MIALPCTLDAVVIAPLCALDALLLALQCALAGIMIALQCAYEAVVIALLYAHEAVMIVHLYALDAVHIAISYSGRRRVGYLDLFLTPSRYIHHFSHVLETPSPLRASYLQRFILILYLIYH